MRRADNLTTSICRLSWNLGASTSWNPQGLYRACFSLFLLKKNTQLNCTQHFQLNGVSSGAVGWGITVQYKLESRGFHSRWCYWEFLLDLLVGLTQLLTEMNTANISCEGRVWRRPVHRADNLVTTYVCRFSISSGASTSWSPKTLYKYSLLFFPLKTCPQFFSYCIFTFYLVLIDTMLKFLYAP